MARNLGPKCKQCRREGLKLFLKGERCLTEKCAVERRSYPPGEHGRGRIKQSEYLLQLREKQKARRYYGLLEKQFRGYYAKAGARIGHHRRDAASPARDQARQRRHAPRFCVLALASPTTCSPRAFSGERAPREHPQLSAQTRGRDHGQAGLRRRAIDQRCH